MYSHIIITNCSIYSSTADLKIGFASKIIQVNQWDSLNCFQKNNDSTSVDLNGFCWKENIIFIHISSSFFVFLSTGEGLLNIRNQGGLTWSPKIYGAIIECLDWLLLSHNPLWNFTQSCGWININSLSVPLFTIRKKSLTVLFIQWECFVIERFVQQSSLVNSLLCLDFYCSHCFAFSRSLTWVGDVLLTDLYFLRNRHHD